MAALTVAIPSSSPGGLESGTGMHFGHCEVFTLVEVDEGQIKSVRVLENPPHQEGACLAPVNRLAEQNVNVLLAGGMGMRPLMGFHQAGINVYHAASYPTVGEAVKAFAEGRLQAFSDDFTCKGGCGGH